MQVNTGLKIRSEVAAVARRPRGLHSVIHTIHDHPAASNSSARGRSPHGRHTNNNVAVRPLGHAVREQVRCRARAVR
jgi:hypothetical protein